MSFTADVGQPRRSSKDVEGDRLTALTEQQMSIRATPCVGYWAAYYINRDGGWSVACDALGRIIRCETEKLALSVARYRRRRLLPFRGSPDLAERQHGRISVGGGLLFTQQFEGSAWPRQWSVFVPNTASCKSRKTYSSYAPLLPDATARGGRRALRQKLR